MIKRILKKILPTFVLEFYCHNHLQAVRSRNRKLTTKQVFTEIYQKNAWGGEPGEYCSGDGSHPSFAPQYADMVMRVCRENGLNTIVDLGCGDFTIGRHLQGQGLQYTGVDIVEGLVTKNNAAFSNEMTSFVALDIIEDDLPRGELCLVRQVFQHLSNEQIQKVLQKMSNYKMAIVTEHFPLEKRFRIANLDKPHGGDTRVIDHSAVCLDKPPFNLGNYEELLRVTIHEQGIFHGDTIRSHLIRF